MQKYTGTKIVLAKPMNRLEYNQYRGWEVPADENPQDEGYLVEYVDGGKSNHEKHDGYISWSPKDVFERAYNLVDGDGSPMLSVDQQLELSIKKTMQLLDAAHHPHTTIILTSTTAEIVEGVKVVKNDILRD